VLGGTFHKEGGGRHLEIGALEAGEGRVAGLEVEVGHAQVHLAQWVVVVHNVLVPQRHLPV